MLPLKYILGIKISIQGATNLNLEGPYVMVANHQSNVDYLGMLAEQSSIDFLSYLVGFYTTFLTRKIFKAAHQHIRKYTWYKYNTAKF